MKMLDNLSNAEYHALSQVSSSVLKAALLSKAHLKQILTGKKKTTDAMLLGTAIHCYYLERERFNAEYKEEPELYLRASGVHKAGDPKLDDDGEPLINLITPEGEIIKGETYKKFKAMCEVIDNNARAKEMLKGAKTEVSIIGANEKVRPDMITEDGFIVDVKTVGGTTELPCEESNFARTFWDLGYDLQMYMYTKLCKEAGIDVKGFVFMCVDTKIPAGIRYFVFNLDDEWFNYGEKRYNDAWARYNEYKENPNSAPKYEVEVVQGLPLPFKAIGELSK